MNNLPNLIKMKNFSRIFTLFFSCIMLLAMLGCNGHSDRLYPYGWTRTEPAFDSLTLKAERAFFNRESDSVVESIVKRMGEMAKSDPSIPEKMSRYHYWHARLHLRHFEIEKAMDEFNVALALTDSARNPYDVARIRWNMELEQTDGAEGYFDALKKAELFKSFHDLPMEADYRMILGAIMNEVGNPTAALRYLNTADSLLLISQLYPQLAANKINRARALEKAGREREAAAVLKDALNDSVFCKEPMAVNIAQWNLYLYTDSLPMLRAAYDGLDCDLNRDTMRPLYGAFLIKEYARLGLKDSVAKYLPIVEPDSAAMQHHNEKRDFYIGLAEGEKALGNKEAALEYYSRAIRVVNEILDDDIAEEIIKIEQRRIIDETTYQAEIKRKDRTLWLLAALAITAIVAVVVIIFYHRRLANQQKEHMQATLAEEQAKRKVLALEIAMEENRRLGENIRETMDSLRKDGLVDPAATGTLEATLKSHDITIPAQEDFVTTFSDVNPRFLEALNRKYPSLTKTERRLAVYISLGLDNKHISRLTGVRPESVKQARWRLRNKLNLPEDVSLEDEMRRLAEEFF